MTLKDYIQTLPKDRVALAATDLNEASKIEQEHAATPGAVFEDAGQVTGQDAPAENPYSFDINSDDDAKKFIGGMELSHPALTNKLRRDPAAWQEMIDLDASYNQRMKVDGGFKLSGDETDEDYFKWAYGRGILESDTSAAGLIGGFAKGLWGIIKGGAKLGALAGRAAVDTTAAGQLAATTVDAARSAVSEYEQLGAGLAALTSGDDPQVEMMAKFELAKFAAEEQKNHNAWRKAVSDSFAEIPVDEDSVEALSEAFDVSNLIGAGAGKLVTRGLKRAGAGGAAEVLGKSRKFIGSELAAEGMSKIPVVGAPYKRAILQGQIDGLSTEAQVAFEAAALDKSRLAAMRATLAANPAASGRDTLLKQIAEGEKAAATSQAAFDAVNGQLNARRVEVTEALDLEGRGLLNRAGAGTLELVGSGVVGTGRAVTGARKALSGFLTGETDDQVVGGAADAVTGGLTGQGNLITRTGRDMKTVAQTAKQNGATIPYFRRLRQNRDASKLTRGVAALVDNTQVAWALDGAADLATAGAAGAPVSGLFGYFASGGDMAAAAESAGAGGAFGIGGGAYGQWQAFKDPSYRYEELLANRRQFRDTLSQREVNGESQMQIFDQMDAGEQLALASYAQGKPDVAFRFINEPGGASGYYSRDENVVVINKASKTPVEDIFRHEIAHFVERHGLEAQVREMYLGDVEKGVIGQYTDIDKLGNPVFVESTSPEGETTHTYKLNAEGERLKSEYEAKVRAFDPAFVMSPEYLASELFAEQYADHVFRGGLRRDMRRNAADNVVEALANKPLLKEFMGGIGLLFDRNDNVVGTDVFTGLKSNGEVRKLISKFSSDVAKGRKVEIAGEVEDHVFTETELRDPTVATKWLQAGGAVRFGPDGKPVFDAKGTPQFLTEKEADAVQRDFANELIAEIEKHVAANPTDADLIQRREVTDIKGVKRTVFTGRRIPIEVIDALDAQKRFNPHQIAHLRAMSASSEKHGVGAMVAHFYQAASRKLSGKAYKTVGGRWRRDGIVGFQITKDGNVVINSVSWEQLAENARKAAKTKSARDTYATAGIPIDAEIIADTKQYLSNLIDGKPGAEGLGEKRRDFVNNLLGIRIASNADVNPLFETTSAPKIILTNLRLDRMNRVSPLDSVEYAWGPAEYRRAKMNLRPEESGKLPRRYVSEAAIRFDGELFAGETHFDALEQMKEQGFAEEGADIDDVADSSKGFVDNSGKFLTRREAAELAMDSGQLSEETAKGAIWELPGGPSLEAEGFNEARKFRPETKKVDSKSNTKEPLTRGNGSKVVPEKLGGARDRADVPAGPQFDGDRLPEAVKAKTLSLVHYTNAALGKAQELDPKFMGKGRATPADQQGAPATFYFVKGSPLNADRDIIARGKNTYSAEVSGARIYDGINDPLDHWSEINRWKADQKLIDAGYVGKQFKFRDGRQAVMLFEKAKVTDRGLYDGKARAGFAEAPRKLREEDSPQFRPDSNDETQRVASAYMQQRFGDGYEPHANYDELPEAKIRLIADFFENETTHDPRNPEVRASYNSLVAETKAQYEAMVDAGVKIEPWLAGKGEPYKSSVEMMKDVRDNKHLFFFLTDNGFGSDGKTLEHPMLEPSGIKLGDRELLNNDLFRAVHDYFGHTPQGFQFGPRGEFNAWRSHSAMFSPEAQGALAAETLAQNAWVNFGPHLRDAEGKIAGKGQPGYVAPQDRPFADQRAFVLPKELLQFRPDSELGEIVAKTFKSNPVAEVLSKVAEGVGPFDGGCLVCATALQNVIGGEIVQLAWGGQAQHYGVKLGDMIYDGAGATSEKLWADKFARAEAPNLLGKLKLKPGIDSGDEIPSDPAASTQIAASLRAALAQDRGQRRPDAEQVKARGVSTAPIFDGSEAKPDLGEKPRAEEIGRGLAARSRAMKRIPYDSRTDAAKDVIATTLSDEIAHALTQHDNARGWYEAKVSEAMSELAKVHPETAEDPARGSFFKAILAITSNGQKVLDNFKRADELYSNWKETGRLETAADWGGARKNQINGGLATLQSMVDERGLEATAEFLNSKFTVGELKKLGHSVNGDAVDHVVWGSAIFGPKVGAGFYPNLQGDFSPVTMDLWLMRTWNRINGSYGVADPVGMGRALADLRSAAESNPDAPEAKEIGRLSDRQLGNWAETRFADWTKRQFKDPTPFDRPAKRFSESKSGVEESPRNSSERAWIRTVFAEVDKKLESRGLPAMNNADKQALLWYYEKDLYAQFGYRDRNATPQDYATAARAVAAARAAR